MSTSDDEWFACNLVMRKREIIMVVPTKVDVVRGREDVVRFVVRSKSLSQYLRYRQQKTEKLVEGGNQNLGKRILT